MRFVLYGIVGGEGAPAAPCNDGTAYLARELVPCAFCRNLSMDILPAAEPPHSDFCRQQKQGRCQCSNFTSTVHRTPTRSRCFWKSPACPMNWCRSTPA